MPIFFVLDRKRIFSYDFETQKLDLVQNLPYLIDVSIQTRSCLYAYEYWPEKWSQFQNIHKKAPIMTVKAKPNFNKSVHLSLTNFHDLFIFVSGGFELTEGRVFRYEIQTDSWDEAAQMPYHRF